MNCIYAGAFIYFDRDFEETIQYIDKLFLLKGTVLPTSTENKVLTGLRENGEMLYSEAEIVELRSNALIEQVYLLDKAPDKIHFENLDIEEKRKYLYSHHCFVATSEGVKSAIDVADIIIYSAGTQHSSLYPTYLSSGLAESIANSKALKVFITNIGADYETPTYKASDYINGAFRYLSMFEKRRYVIADFFDLVLINISKLKENETYVEFDESSFFDIPVRRLIGNFESINFPGTHAGEKIVEAILADYESITSIN
jgi:2-phospho-L-lactate transferase/gluconeogenesis factor (CofD/UPF0052 family)